MGEPQISFTGFGPWSQCSVRALDSLGDADRHVRLVSHQFVVLAYGASPYLPACLDSVCQQAGSKVIMTTSTPSSYVSDLARLYGVELYTAGTQRGIGADWNFALSCATADLVTLAHQDDIYYPGFAEQTCALFASNPDATLCFTEYDEIDDAGRRLPRGRVLMVKRALRSLAVGQRSVVDAQRRKRRLLAFGTTIPCPTVTLNRSALPDFRFSEEYQINLDWDAWWRLHTLDGPFLLSPCVLMGHRIHQQAETSRGKQDGRRREEDRKMFHRIWPAPIARFLGLLYRAGY